MYIFSILVYFILSLYDIGGISVSRVDEPYINYYTNPVLRQIYIFALILNILVVAILLYEILGKPSKRIYSFLKITLVILICIQISLVWYELYYGSTFSYGEVRDKQGLPIIGLNNIGFVGSIFFCLLLFNIVFGKWFQKKPFRLIVGNGILYLALVGLHVILYLNLKDSWKIWTS